MVPTVVEVHSAAIYHSTRKTVSHRLYESDPTVLLMSISDVVAVLAHAAVVLAAAATVSFNVIAPFAYGISCSSSH